MTQALREKLPPIFDGLVAAPLALETVSALPERAQGVYMLLDNGSPTYVGKTDAKHGFRNRLQRHYFTLSSRQNLDIGSITFKAVRVMVFTTVNVEDTLIEHYLRPNKLAWQFTGFGSNDPGHRREGQEPSEFDKRYPINIDAPLRMVKAGECDGLALLILLKDELPYEFRYETDRGLKHSQGHGDHRSVRFIVPRDSMTLRELLKEVIIPQLPAGWMATIFHGRVILYKESTRYQYAIDAFKK